MTSYQFVTTFSRDGYACYGQRFVDSFVEHSKGIPLVVYHESQEDVDFHDLLTWSNLDHDLDRQKFIEDHGADPVKVSNWRHPNQQSIRFCHKVFAITDAIRRATTDWVVWIDADSTITKTLGVGLMQRVCPSTADVVYLGRVDMPYTECGFVGYRAAALPVRRLAEDMRHVYTSGELFTWPQNHWHDSQTFDTCLKRSTIREDRRYNLSQHVRGSHVWPHTVLGEFCVHNKGPQRKRAAYGSIVP